MAIWETVLSLDGCGHNRKPKAETKVKTVSERRAERVAAKQAKKDVRFGGGALPTMNWTTLLTAGASPGW
ncbi:hypothetical protein [Rhizobium sp. S9]|uniref:hypothetical protein n=1 Tax=Rhizobium sp. S9 TaxID=2035454 RepID=UPI001485140C|nr:hypothetical protein [Rhizobium sp. S9]